MRHQFLYEGEWDRVIEALVDSGIPPREVLRAALGRQKFMLAKMAHWKVDPDVLERLKRSIKVLRSLDEKYSAKDLGAKRVWEKK